MPDIKDFAPQLTAMLTELERRAASARLNRLYLNGNCPHPRAITQARLTKSYNALMPMAGAPWASLAVDSVLDRLEVGGIRTGDKQADQDLWRMVWQANAMDSESKLGHQSVMTNGRAYATIWPDADGNPEVVLDSSEQMIVMYAEGRHQPRHRIAALRYWSDEDDSDRKYMTLYRADGLYKFVEAREQADRDEHVKVGGTYFKMREEIGRDGLVEPWPLENPFRVVPVVEIATNRQLQAGSFPYARGEFSHCLGLLDRINLLTFLGLVVAVWMGFPLRYMIGDKILRDDDNNPIPPFEGKPNELAQIENPAAKIGQLEAADRKNLSIFDELSQFAAVTKTPAHYFPNSTGLSNISADMIRALEGGLHAKVDGIHKPFVGQGTEEVLRVGGLMLPSPIEVPPEASIWWIDKQSRSLAEAADAAGKLKDILPPLFIAEKFLGLTQEEIGRIESEGMGNALTQLLAAAREPAPAPEAEGAPVAG